MVTLVQAGGPGAFVSDIFREIDEELRRDNLLKLWAKYGRYIILAVVLAAAIAGGIVAWRDHLSEQRKAVSIRYYGALGLVSEGKDKEAAALFASIAQDGGGYAGLAELEHAELLAKSGDLKGAEAIYQKIASSSSDPEFRDLTVLLSVMHAPPDTDAKATIARLEPLTASGRSWRTTALELTAAVHLRSGDKAAALAIYKKLADDLAAPEGLRARAAEIVAALSS
jgi:hypothetical protein